MTTAMITFKYQGNGVVFDSTEKMWNLTEMHRAVGSPKNKAPYEWLRQQQAQEYITALAEQETTGLNRSFVETREGRNGGTWAHWQIAAAYAHYLDARFYLQWNEWAMERAQQIASGDGAAPLARVVALEERVAVLEVRGWHQLASGQATHPVGAIVGHLVITGNPDDRLTGSEIATALAARGIIVAATQRGAEVIIAQVLRRLGARCTRPCMQGTASRRRTWFGVRLVAETPEEGQ